MLKVKFEPTITLGNIVSALTIVGLVIGLVIRIEVHLRDDEIHQNTQQKVEISEGVVEAAMKPLHVELRWIRNDMERIRKCMEDGGKHGGP